MIKVHAYLARIKDQEKEVIAVPDGAGRALCVSSDKHWTLTREWDELHIIAPLVEDEEKPTGFGKHENTTALAVDDRDIEAVKVESVDDGKWWIADGTLINTCEFPNADEARDAADEYLELAKGAEAVARAIEAKEDPIMVRTRELLDLAHPGEYAWTGAFETCRKIAEAEAKKVRDA